MIRRRDLLLSGLGLAAVGGAAALKPRKRLILLRNTTIEETIPRDFGGWAAQAAGDLVGPEQAGRLARSLYSELVSRVYYEAATGAGVMLLAAYGDTQSDLLQLHRPEICYPAVGFTLELARSADLPVGGAILPVRQVIAAKEDRLESIVYWARMGEALPQTGQEQRMARLENAVHGDIPDGILVRCSTLGDPAAAFEILNRFITLMLHAVPPAKRPALVGNELARRIA